MSGDCEYTMAQRGKHFRMNKTFLYERYVGQYADFRKFAAISQNPAVRKYAFWSSILNIVTIVRILMIGPGHDFFTNPMLLSAYIFSIPTFLISWILRNKREKYWRFLEVVNYLALLSIPFWAMMVKELAVAYGRPANDLLLALGFLVFSCMIYLLPIFLVPAMVVIVVLALLQIRIYLGWHYYVELASILFLGMLCIFLSVMKFREGYQAFRDRQTAERASHAKDFFLANVSHEIRTPINIVIGSNEMILRQCQDEETLGYATDAKNAGNMLLTLVNDILDLSKIESGKMEITPVAFRLDSMLNDIVLGIQVRAKQKGLELKLDVDPNTPVALCGDDIRIKQVLINLLTNAVKYTQSGSVTFAVSVDEKNPLDPQLLFRVSDTGIGIKQEDLPYIFEKYQRVDEEHTRHIEGTGLGMSIVTDLLKLMHGTIQVQSSYGMGTTFEVRIPELLTDDRTPIGNLNAQFIKSHQTRQKYHASFTAPNARILVVDDNATNCKLATVLLRDTQITVDTAASGTECLQKVQEQHYDMIFLDHRMPDIEGPEVFRRMQTIDHACKGAPVIALTANAQSNAQEEYEKIGFDGFLSKPIIPEKLEAMIRQKLPAGMVKAEPGSS